MKNKRNNYRRVASREPRSLRLMKNKKIYKPKKTYIIGMIPSDPKGLLDDFSISLGGTYDGK